MGNPFFQGGLLPPLGFDDSLKFSLNFGPTGAGGGLPFCTPHRCWRRASVLYAPPVLEGGFRFVRPTGAGGGFRFVRPTGAEGASVLYAPPVLEGGFLLLFF